MLTQLQQDALGLIEEDLTLALPLETVTQKEFVSLPEVSPNIKSDL